jgi:DNA polymerase III epsilon subunit-like protein
MPLTLFFDTETTGLPVNKKMGALECKGNWPDLVSISWSVYDEDVCVKRVTHIVRPDLWTIPEESIAIHKITMERAQAEGVPLAEVLEEFHADLVKCSRVVAHNMEFDKNIIFNAFAWRLGKDPRKFWLEEAEFCSLEKSKNELKLPARYPKPWDMYKMPRLDELYEATFKEPAPAGAHRADRDVEVLEKIVWARWPELFIVKQES